MEYVLAIVLAAAVGYVILAWKMKLAPFKAANQNELQGQFKRLQIPLPNIKFYRTTLKGTGVESVAEVPQVALDTIDAALDELFIWYKHAYPAWANGFSHRAYKVLFIDPMAINQESTPGSPAIKVQGQQSAGTCIGFSYPMVYIVLPHQEQQGWTFRDYLFESVFVEGEHFIESLNDRDVFNKFVGPNDRHRHIGPPQGMAKVGFAAVPTSAASCGLEKYKG